MSCDCAQIDDLFPERSALTGAFRKGAPRNFTVSAAGHRAAYLRSSGPEVAILDLWLIEQLESTPVERLLVAAASCVSDDENLSPAERARRERLRESGSGITGFATDLLLSTVCFALSGQLWVCDVASSNAMRVGDYSSVIDPRLNSRGDAVAFTDGADFVVYNLLTETETLRIVASKEHEAFGLSDFIAAEELDRHRGHWWAPAGDALLVEHWDESAVEVRWISDPTHPEVGARAHRYPQAGTQNAAIDLRLINLKDGSVSTIEWNRSEFEYLVNVSWPEGGPLITLATRDQRKFVTFELREQTLAELHTATDVDWVDAGVGVPARIGDLLLVEELSPNARLLKIGKHQVDLGGRHVEQVVAASKAGVIAAVYNQPWQREIVHVQAGKLSSWSDPDGYALAVADGPYAAVIQSRLDSMQPRYFIKRNGEAIFEVASCAELPPTVAQPRIHSLTENEIPGLVLFPKTHQLGSHKLPVIVSTYGGPHHSEVVADARSFAMDQWLANQGFAVVVLDNRGTPGKGPAWERAVHYNLADPVLMDQVAGLQAMIQQYPADLDATRVGITGWSFGGYLSALAVLERPDVYHAAWAGAPVTDWNLYDTGYTERYMGLPSEHAADYDNASLLQKAAKLQRPLMLIHGLADDNVLAANSLQLSGALLTAGRPHGFLPLAGVSHMTPQVNVSRNLLLLMRNFFVEHLQS